ncbi:DUF4231 domain-containing protein [Streptomyces sp. NRRL F-5126]|uniref:DUF4231 domain-containing protein n=1 Tax=Streptomyces sp. NRRL F-5126 TaxID=1463857 RepID=UPI000692191A|nr:DUF4231 domain-containing protein [Streptomyces sp. NRRL F-5126]
MSEPTQTPGPPPRPAQGGGGAPSTVALSDADLPGLFHAADSASLRAQRHYLRASSLRLALALIAAVVGVVSLHVAGVEAGALGVAVAFALALMVEVWLALQRPEEEWVNGRAVAESVKTLAWRFAVGAHPFPRTCSDEGAEEALKHRQNDLLLSVPEATLIPPVTTQVSAGMRRLRSEDLATRKEGYLSARIMQQYDWYARKARWNASRAQAWRMVLVASEVCGIALALARAYDAWSWDLSGIAAAIVGAGAAWLGTKQHQPLARNYTIASHELLAIHARLTHIDDEETWAAEVADAEEAISREHTMWRASRASAT